MKPSITVVSLGPGDPKLLTLQSYEAIKNAKHLVLRTAHHRTAEYLQEQGIAFESFDALYDQYDDFDALHFDMADKLWSFSEKKNITFAVIDATTDGAVKALKERLPAEGKLQILPGVTVADACLSLLPHTLRHAGRVRIMPAIDVVDASPDPSTPLLITELWDRVLAGEVKLRLSDIYGDEALVCFFPSSVNINRKPQVIPLCEMDRQPRYDHTVAVYIPQIGLHDRQRYCFDDLLHVMHILRQQCPWDGEQTHESLRKYLIEEAYEACDAIDDDDMEHLADELGDVLLQIAFHSDIAQTAGEFSIGDVTTAIVRKMIFRHAHIFGDVHCATADDVVQSWEKLKKLEKGLSTQASVLADISKGLPALMRAEKVQKKAAQVGFDWDDAIGALPKIHEETEEVLAELEAGGNPAEELGDLLFSVVNVARLAGHTPELLLKAATDKFIRRFTAMENLIISDEKSLEGLTLAEMDVYWNRVKANEKTIG